MVEQLVMVRFLRLVRCTGWQANSDPFGLQDLEWHFFDRKGLLAICEAQSAESAPPDGPFLWLLPHFGREEGGVLKAWDLPRMHVV